MAHLPGLAMSKTADLYPGQSKTDPRDAFIIADTTRTINRVRSVLVQIGVGCVELPWGIGVVLCQEAGRGQAAQRKR